jgi:hypothetical protein
MCEINVVTIFSVEAADDDIIATLAIDGIAGWHGRRTDVRKKLQKISDLLRTESQEQGWCLLSIDHPTTEIGIAYHPDKFDSINVAKNLVITSYETELHAMDLSRLGSSKSETGPQ